MAAIVVCLVAAVVTIPGVLISRESVPDMSRVAQTPWWAWAGTAAAAVPVITTLLFAGQLGGAAFNGLVVTATIATSVLLDHFGLLGFAPHPATFWRIAGAFIMVAGLALVCLF